MPNFQYIVDIMAKNGQFVQAMNQNIQKTGDLDKKIKAAQQQTNNMMDSARKLAGVIGVAFSTAAIIDFGKASIEAYNNSIQSETALLTALKGRVSIQQNLISQATDLMGKTLFDDDEIVRAQSLVAAFVKEETKIKELIPLIQDMATAKQMDLAGAADLVTKTLAGEMNALGRYGIKVEGAAGSSERLAMITKGLNDAFGGQAEAAAKVGTAALIQLNNEYGNLKEAIGKVIIENQNLEGSFTKTLSGAIGQVTEMISGAEKYQLAPLWSEDRVKQFVGNLPEGIEKQRELIGNEIDRLGKEIQQRKAFFESNPAFKFDLVKMFIGNQAKDNARFDLSVVENQSKMLVEALKNLSPKTETETATTKTYANSISGLNERLKDYNEQLQEINPNDRAALMLRLDGINAIEKQIEAIDKLKKAMQTMAEDNASGFRNEAFMQITPITKANVTGTGKEFNTTAKLDISDFTANASRMVDANKYIQDSIDATDQKVKMIQESFDQGFNQIGNAVLSGLGLAKDGFEGFVGGLAETAIKLISMMLAQSLATSIFNSEQSAMGTGPAAVFTAPVFMATSIAGVLGAFATIPKFADGGIVYGETLGIMGEYPGAASNPEVIAPLDKLKAMIGGGNNQPIILLPSIDFSGDKMRVMLERVDSNRTKRTGR